MNFVFMAVMAVRCGELLLATATPARRRILWHLTGGGIYACVGLLYVYIGHSGCNSPEGTLNTGSDCGKKYSAFHGRLLLVLLLLLLLPGIDG